MYSVFKYSQIWVSSRFVDLLNEYTYIFSITVKIKRWKNSKYFFSLTHFLSIPEKIDANEKAFLMKKSDSSI